MDWDELVELLLPREDPARRLRARGLRPGPRSLAPAPSRAGAERELAELARRRVLRAVESLLVLHLGAALPRGSALWFGEPEVDHLEAWRELARAGAGALPDLALPAPGESVTALARRLLELARRHGARPADLERWSWRLELLGELLVHEPPDASVAGRLAGAPDLPEERRVDLAALLLDRGEVRAARRLLTSTGRPRDGRGRQLLDWCEVVLDGPLRGERRGGAPTRPRRGPGPLPGPLLTLRAADPVWAGMLVGTGREPAGRRPAPRGFEPVCSGVVLLPGRPGVLPRLPSERAPAPCAWPVSPRRDRCLVDEELELLRTAAVVRRYAPPGQDLARAAGAGVLARTWVPLVDPRGELRGWLRGDFEHRYLPADGDLLAWARGRCSGLLHDPPATLPPLERESPGCARVLAALLPRGAAGARGYLLEEGRLHEVLRRGGTACEPRPSELERAAACERAIAIDGGRAAVLPVGAPGRCLALLVLEFARPLGERGLELLEERARRAWPLLVRALLEERVGRAPLLAGLAGPDGLATLGRDLLECSRPGRALWLHGPPGSGRTSLARWLHVATARRPERWCEVWPADLDRLPALERAHEGGTLFFPSLEELAPRERALLGRFLERRVRRGPRTLCVFRSGGRGEVPWLPPGARVGVRCIPGAGERRREVLAIAEELVGPRERWTEDGLAQLFRQEWAGGLAELVGWLVGWCAPEGTVDGEAVRTGLGSAGIEPVARLVPARSSPGVLVEALAATRLASGRVNKSAAARFLGWDPDTLVARMERLPERWVEDLPPAWLRRDSDRELAPGGDGESRS